MGISEKNLPFVFDRFWQADGSSKRKYQGVGIGLALVKELVEIQWRQRSSVQSQEGKGTTFTVPAPVSKGRTGGNSPNFGNRVEALGSPPRPARSRPRNGWPICIAARNCSRR